MHLSSATVQCSWLRGDGGTGADSPCSVKGWVQAVLKKHDKYHARKHTSSSIATESEKVLLHVPGEGGMHSRPNVQCMRKYLLSTVPVNGCCGPHTTAGEGTGLEVAMDPEHLCFEQRCLSRGGFGHSYCSFINQAQDFRLILRTSGGGGRYAVN